jgi:hypothetical protein
MENRESMTDRWDRYLLARQIFRAVFSCGMGDLTQPFMGVYFQARLKWKPTHGD